MPDTYVQLPDGKYLHIPADAKPEQLSAMKVKLRNMFPTKFEQERTPKGSAGEGAWNVLSSLPGGIASMLDPTTGLSGAALAAVGLNPRSGGVKERLGEIPAVKAVEEMHSASKDPDTAPWEVPVAGLGALVGKSAERGREQARHAESGLIAGEALTEGGLVAASPALEGVGELAEKVGKGAAELPRRTAGKLMYGGKGAITEAIEKVKRENLPKIEQYLKEQQEAKVSNRSKYEAQEAERKAKEVAEQEGFEKDARRSLAKARSTYEAGEAERATKAAEAKKQFETDAKRALAKSRSVYEEEEAGVAKKNLEAQKGFSDEAKQSLARARSEHEKALADIEEKKAERARQLSENENYKKTQQNLENERRDTANRIVQNLDLAELAERSELDTRYKEFDRKILGVDEQHPNGTLTSNLSEVGNAVEYAKKNILKGSDTSIAIFRDIMGRLKEVVESADGSVKPLEGQNISTSQLRGYVRELQDAAYDKPGIPGDVREALKHVEQAAKDEVDESIRDVHGKTAQDIYKKLSADWSEYKRIWFDRSSLNVLPQIRKFLRDFNRSRSGLDVRESVTKLLNGQRGENLQKLLSSKTKWGADPSLINRYMAVENMLDKMEIPYKRVAAEPQESSVAKISLPSSPTLAEAPTYADLNIPSPPEAPEAPNKAAITLPSPPKSISAPTEAAVKFPTAPTLADFDPEEFVRTARESRIKTLNRYGVWASAIWALHDVLNGKVPTMAIGSIPSTLFLENILRKPAIMRWLLKDVPPPTRFDALKTSP
jgi:hypothetical protein